MSATISTIQPSLTCSINNTFQIHPKSHPFGKLNFQNNPNSTHKFGNLILTHKCNNNKKKRVKSSEEDVQIPETVVEEDGSDVSTDTTEPVAAVPVSPADKLIMFFQAEGTMNDAAISTVTQALEGTEGISDVRVFVSEGIATVELIKETTIQATGVASGLLETIQGGGFRLNTLNLSFEDQELVTV